MDSGPGPRRFLVPPPALEGEVVELPTEEAAHAFKVLRLEAGREVELIDGRGLRARAVIESIDKRGAVCRVLSREEAPHPRPRLVICPGLLKNPAMDLLAQKLTELAVDEVRPFISSRSVPREARGEKKRERWERLAGQALKQSGAPRAPLFQEPLSLAEVLDLPPAGAVRLFLYEKSQAPPPGPPPASKENGAASEEVWVLVGPEGGFAPEEARLAEGKGFTACGLPHTILRAETASLAAAVLVRFSQPARPPASSPPDNPSGR